MFDGGRLFQPGVGNFLEGNGFATPHGNIGGDEEFAGGIVDAVGQGIGAESAKHHRMDRADPGAGQHGDGGLGDHGHVNGHAIAFLDAEGFQDVGAFADVGVKFAVSDLFDFIFGVALPDDGEFIPQGRFDMAIKAIDGEVQLAVFEERVLDFAGGGVPSEFAGDGGLFEPFKGVGLFQPEGVGAVYGLFVQRVKLVGVDQGVLFDFG